MKKRILSLILVCATLLTAIPLVVLPVAATAATFAPDVRFVLVSDIHYAVDDKNPGSNIGQMMDRLNAYLTEKGDSVLPSAIVALGDLTDWATNEEYAGLKPLLQAATSGYQTKYGQALPIYAVMGNHEYNNGQFLTAARKGADAAKRAYIPVSLSDLGIDAAEALAGTADLSTYYEANNAAFQTAFLTNLEGAIANDALNWHYEVGGVHFIGISIENNYNCLSAGTLAWLDAELEKATKDTPNAPVFLFSHAPLRDTVYADNWSHRMPTAGNITSLKKNQTANAASLVETEQAFTAVIEKYPNVIFSTGHTHASISGGEEPFFYQAETNGAGTGFTAYSPGALTNVNSGNGDFSIVEIDNNGGKTTVRFYPQHVEGGTYKNADGTDLYYEVVYEGETETVSYADVEIDSNYTSIYTHPTSTTAEAINDFTINGETLTFAPAWTIGAYSFDNGKTYLYDQYNSSAVFYTELGDLWNNGGMYVNNNNIRKRKIIVGAKTVAYVAYTAEKSGTLDFTVDNLELSTGDQQNKDNSNAYSYVVVKNFSEVLTAAGTWKKNATDWTVFGASTLTDITVENVKVQKGDVVSFVFARGSGSGDGIVDVQMHVDYTKEVETREYVGEATSYEHKVGGENFPLTGFDADGKAILATDGVFEVGTGYNLERNPYNADTGTCIKHKRGNPSAYGCLNYDGSILLPTNGAMISYVLYTAEYDGRLDFIVKDLTFQREGVVFTVLKNFDSSSAYALIGEEEQNNTYGRYDKASNSRKYWQYSEIGASYSFAVCDIEVKAGDIVAIVFDKGISMNDDQNVGLTNKNLGPVAMNIDVRYTRRDADVLTSKVSDNLSLINAATTTVDWTGSTWMPIVYEDRSTAGNVTDALAMTRYNSDESSYTADAFNTNALAKAHAYISTGKSSNQRGPLGAIMVSCNSAAGFRYVAEKTGNVRLSFEKAGSETDSANAGGSVLPDELVMGYAIYVNGVKVWPYGDNNWYNLRQDASRTKMYYTEQLNAVMPDSLFVTEGDCIEFLCRNDNGVANAWHARGNIFLPQISYENATPEISATLNDKFAITLHNVGTLGEGSATLGGEAATLVANANGTYTLVGIAAKQMGDEIILDYAYGATAFDRGDVTVDVPHAQTDLRFTLSDYGINCYADLMKNYINAYAEDTTDKGQTVVDLAAAVLNYGAAAQTYFNYNADALVNADLTDDQKAINYAGEYEDRLGVFINREGDETTIATPYAVTLLLEDSISMKLLVTSDVDLTAGYKVRFTLVNGKSTVAELEKTADGAAYKAIFTGLTPAQWNNTYTITVVDEDNKAVSSTIAYSASSYAVRMAGDAETTAVTDKMLALYEKAMAFVNAWA